MGIKSRKTRVGLAIFGVLLLCGVAGFLALSLSPAGYEAEQGKGTNILSLARPALAAEATSFLYEEAGISIYTNLGTTLCLSTARDELRTVERETDDHIVGSIALPGLDQNHDPHCFVQKDGWVVVYYLKSELASKVVDWAHYSGGTLTSHNLQAGLAKMCAAHGLTPNDPKYFHFGYEEANEWMIVGDWKSGAGSNSFDIKIPSGYQVYERSWSHYFEGYNSIYCWARLSLNDDQLSYFSGASSGTWRLGSLTISQMLPDVFHSFKVETNHGSTRSGIALVLIYRVP